MSKTMVLVGTLDTRGDEVAYLQEQIELKGYQVLIIDVGVMGEPMCAADYDRSQVAVAGGSSIDQLISAAQNGADRNDATQVMIQGAKAILADLSAKNAFAGAMCLGGSTGTAIGAAIMKDIPSGLPKLVLTTFINTMPASAKDIVVMQAPIDLIGLNLAVKETLVKAAGALIGMVEAKVDVKNVRPQIGITALGVTTPAVQKISDLLAEQGFDSVVFHALTEELNQLIEKGKISGVIDLTPFETVPYALYSQDDMAQMSAAVNIQGERLAALKKHKIPVVAATGGLDIHIFPGPETIEGVPQQYQGRAWTNHGPNIVLVRLSEAESKQVAEALARQLQAALGPVALFIPTQGFSEASKSGAPLHDPATDLILMDSLKDALSATEINEYQGAINDDQFAQIIVSRFVDLYGPIEVVAEQVEEIDAVTETSEAIVVSDSALINSAINELNEKMMGGEFEKTVKFVIKDEGSFIVDKVGAKVSDNDAQVVIKTTAKTFEGLKNGKINTHMAFLTGKVKVTGDVMYASKLGAIFESIR